MAYDHGFDLPDVRDEFVTTDGSTVRIKILRHWYENEDTEEMDFKVSFQIIHINYDDVRHITELPMGTDESTASEIARMLFAEDEEGSKEIANLRAEEAAERRMGC